MASHRSVRADVEVRERNRSAAAAPMLARLAVDDSARGVGVGAQLLRFVLLLALEMSERIGCAGVVVDAKPGAVEFYARYGFVALELLEGESDARPRPTPMWLPIGAVKRARGAGSPG